MEGRRSKNVYFSVTLNLVVSFVCVLALSILLLPTVSFAAGESRVQAEFAALMKRSVASNTFVFDPRRLRWKAINSKGRVVRSGRASGGANYCRDVRRACRTPVGSFRIISKRGASCRSSRYPLGGGGARMPYCMFFSKYYAIHGSSDVPNRNASHGCIRVLPKDARWLHRNFIKIGTRVKVKSY